MIRWVTTTVASIEDSSGVISVWYKDSDGDGYSDGESQRAYTRPDDEYYLSTELTATDGDCNDNNNKVHPGAEEICDNFIDDDCDGEVDDDCALSVWYKDSDGDGYSDGESQRAYTRPDDEYYLSTELTATDGDCNDNNNKVHPGAEEICDNFIDDDCDGEVDENCTLSVWYKDSDGDGYSDGESQRAYTRPGDEYYLSTELTATDGDCNDDNNKVHPGAEEICDNGIDDDCDGKIDEDCTSGSGECGAYIAPGVWKEFDCYNLAAIGKTTGDDPFTPSWRLIGGYWQWGRKGPDESKWYDTNTSNFAHGPTDSDETDANDDEIDGWDDSYANNDAWSDDEKASNDPCPSGYRMPTEAQWGGVIENNTQSTVGTWLSDSTNYSSGLFFNDDLMLPAAGRRSYDSGTLIYRGDYGSYWSSTEILGTSSSAWRLYFTSSYVGTSTTHRRSGYSVRCIAE